MHKPSRTQLQGGGALPAAAASRASMHSALEQEPALASPKQYHVFGGTQKIFDKERLLSYDIIVP